MWFTIAHWVVRQPYAKKPWSVVRHRGRWLIFALFIGFVSPVFAGNEAFLQPKDSGEQPKDSGEHGQALLFHRSSTCFALTPRHVMAKSRYATLTLPPTEKAPLHGQGDLCAMFKDYDLALLQVTGIPLDVCGDIFAVPVPSDARLGRSNSATLKQIYNDGSIESKALQLRFVVAADHERFFVVRASSAARDDQLRGGDSGSVVYVEDVPVGQLIEVGTGLDPGVLPEGDGKVLRLDTAYGALAKLFEIRSGPEVVLPECFEPPVPIGPASGNLAAASCGAKLLSWSAPPIDGAHRPDILLKPVEQGGYWSATWSAEEQEPLVLVLRLCGDGPQDIAEIVLDGDQVENKAQLPKRVDAFIRPSTIGPWTSLPPVQESKEVNRLSVYFPAKRAVDIMLQIRTTRENTKNVSLGRIVVSSPRKSPKKL